MSDHEKTKRCIVDSYLGFIDTNVLFKKPVSCLFAIASLLFPVYLVIQVIQSGILKLESAKLITASILLILVFIFAGLFGSLIWWCRRIARDEGPKVYPNFRRFIQTYGEWIATVYAIIAFFGGIILLFVAGEYFYSLAGLLPIPVPGLELLIISGPLGGFLIIIATKIVLFLLDPLIWLIKKIWSLLVRIALYIYRCIIKAFGIFEDNTPVWVGVNWLIAVLVTFGGLILGFRLFSTGSITFGSALGVALILALGLTFMAFIIIKRKKTET
ncbi:MAG: hypothetical protein FWC03_09550 [Treponema sp.]|nr:hypothetical protein [Treponema sp.]